MVMTGALTNKLAWFQALNGRHLHFVPEAKNGSLVWDAVVKHDENGPYLLACGRKTLMWAPGILSRMGAPRCQQCCKVSGIPNGYGTPFNWSDEPNYSYPYHREEEAGNEI